MCLRSRGPQVWVCKPWQGWEGQLPPSGLALCLGLTLPEPCLSSPHVLIPRHRARSLSSGPEVWHTQNCCELAPECKPGHISAISAGVCAVAALLLKEMEKAQPRSIHMRDSYSLSAAPSQRDCQFATENMGDGIGSPHF